MFYKLRKKVAARKFDRQISAILDTPPIQVKDAPWCVVSMIAKSDLAMYLLAIKSFYRKLGRGKSRRSSIVTHRKRRGTSWRNMSRALNSPSWKTFRRGPASAAERGSAYFIVSIAPSTNTRYSWMPIRYRR